MPSKVDLGISYALEHKYTASGGSTVSNNASAKRSANKNISKKPSKCSTLPVVGRVGASISLKESHTGTFVYDPKKKSFSWVKCALKCGKKFI